MARASRDHYATLGVDRNASGAEIKAAYRELAMRFHPDRNPGDAEAEARFKELSEAYAVLSDPDRRSRYDNFGALEESPWKGVDVASATEFFDAVFGDLFGLGRKSRAGQDLRYTLEVDFEDAALGCTRTISFKRQEDCRTCTGTGAEGGAAGLKPCARCGGQGYTKQKLAFLPTRRECLACGGSGEVPAVRCATCAGTGLVERERSYDVRIPPRSHRGVSQRVPGEGSPGRRGGPAGDLHVAVRVREHPYFRDEAGVVVCELPVTVTDAMLGAELEVPVLDGAVRMKLPPGTQTGAVFRIRGRGLPGEGGRERGDLHVRVVVETPALPESARAAARALADSTPEGAYPKQRAFREAWNRRRSESN